MHTFKMRSSIAALIFSSSLLISSAAARDIPDSIRRLRDGIKARGDCQRKLADGFKTVSNDAATGSYCGDLLDSAGVIYQQVPGGHLSDMDIDCDGAQVNRSADDGRCATSSDTQPQTSFHQTIESYNVTGVTDLNPFVHSYVVFGNEGKPGWPSFNPSVPTDLHGRRVEPLSVMAVVCGDKMFYGVWGDEHGPTGDHAMMGEAGIGLATACFGNTDVHGGQGHGANDVLYLAFTGPDAVPGAHGAKWDAKTFAEFEESLHAVGDALVDRIAPATAAAPAAPATPAASTVTAPAADPVVQPAPANHPVTPAAPAVTPAAAAPPAGPADLVAPPPPDSPIRPISGRRWDHAPSDPPTDPVSPPPPDTPTIPTSGLRKRALTRSQRKLNRRQGDPSELRNTKDENRITPVATADTTPVEKTRRAPRLHPRQLSASCGGGASCREGLCCSKWGYCGVTPEYCGAGCQSGFGKCDAPAPVSAPVVPEVPPQVSLDAVPNTTPDATPNTAPDATPAAPTASDPAPTAASDAPPAADTAAPEVVNLEAPAATTDAPTESAVPEARDGEFFIKDWKRLAVRGAPATPTTGAQGAAGTFFMQPESSSPANPQDLTGNGPESLDTPSVGASPANPAGKPSASLHVSLPSAVPGVPSPSSPPPPPSPKVSSAPLPPTGPPPAASPPPALNTTKSPSPPVPLTPPASSPAPIPAANPIPLPVGEPANNMILSSAGTTPGNPNTQTAPANVLDNQNEGALDATGTPSPGGPSSPVKNKNKQMPPLPNPTVTPQAAPFPPGDLIGTLPNTTVPDTDIPSSPRAHATPLPSALNGVSKTTPGLEIPDLPLPPDAPSPTANPSVPAVNSQDGLALPGLDIPTPSSTPPPGSSPPNLPPASSPSGSPSGSSQPAPHPPQPPTSPPSPTVTRITPVAPNASSPTPIYTQGAAPQSSNPNGTTKPCKNGVKTHSNNTGMKGQNEYHSGSRDGPNPGGQYWPGDPPDPPSNGQPTAPVYTDTPGSPPDTSLSRSPGASSLARRRAVHLSY